MPKLYKFLADDCVMHTETRRAIYLNQPSTIHTEAYLEWVAEGNTADPADPPSEPWVFAPSRRDVIMSRLAQIDIDSVRALRAKATGKGKPQDDDKLTALEDEATALRTELAGL